MNSISYFYFKQNTTPSKTPSLFMFCFHFHNVGIPKITGTGLMRGYDILRPIVSSLERAQLVLSSYGESVNKFFFSISEISLVNMQSILEVL